MAEKVSTMEVRARIGDLLNRVALRHDEFIIERKGKALAALVPVERLKQMRRVARQGIGELLERQIESGQALGDDEAMAIALQAQRDVRRARRKGKA
jgi:prevent-host-death family protein